MMLVPSGVRVHIALGVTDMRKGLDGLAMLVQEVLKQDPFSGHLFAFRGRKANLIKIVFWDGTGLCLFTKRLEEGRFPWCPYRKFDPQGILRIPMKAASDSDGRLVEPAGTGKVVAFPQVGGLHHRYERLAA